MKEIKQLVEKLKKENADREAQVKELSEKREQMFAAIQRIKEEHDFCRGKINGLEEAIASTAHASPTIETSEPALQIAEKQMNESI